VKNKLSLALWALLFSLALVGCLNQPLPKDAHVSGFKNKITTPWGSSDLQIDEVDTGTAARNATKVTDQAPVAPAKSQ